LIVPKGTQRLPVSAWACGCVSSALASFFASYHHIIPHNITSYIIPHQWHELNTKSIFGRMLCKNENVPRHKVSWEIQLHQLCCKRRDSLFTKYGCFYDVWIFLRSMDIFTKHESFSLQSMKRREGVFRRRLKNGMYIKFHASQRSELKIIYILHSKIYTSNITVLLQQSYTIHLKILLQ
jgi:hypothetical protein